MPSVGWNAYLVLLFINWSLVIGCFCMIPWSEWFWELVTWSCGIPQSVVRMIILSFVVIIVFIVVFIVLFIVLIVFIFVIFVMYIIVVCTVMVVCVSQPRFLVVF